MGERYRTLAVDIGGTNLKLAALWSDGAVIASTQIPTHAEAGPEEGCARLVAALQDLQRQEHIEAREMRAIGIDCAGLVDPEKQIVVDSPNLRLWEGYPLAQRLAAAFGVPTFLENDVNSMAYGEWRLGAGRGTRHMLCLALGTGVGGGIILDGQLYRGARGAAGELGHTTLDMHGPQCSCPNVGCLERHIGSEFIVALAWQKLAASTSASSLRELHGEALTPSVLDRAAEAGDVLAAQVFEEVGALLGQGLVSLVNIFDPERIVLGGGILKAGAKLIEPTRRVVRARAMSVPARHVEVVAAELGDDAALIGATLLAAERVME